MDLDQIAKKISEASSIELELVWIPKIMGNQTDEEKEKFAAIEDNRIGLNGIDASFVTSVYAQIKSGKHLSERQVNMLRKILPKYKRQYLRLIGCGKQKEI